MRIDPRKRTLEYVEEAEGYPLAGRGHPLVGRAGRPDDFVAAVENLCIIRAIELPVS